MQSLVYWVQLSRNPLEFEMKSTGQHRVSVSQVSFQWLLCLMELLAVTNAGNLYNVITYWWPDFSCPSFATSTSLCPLCCTAKYCECSDLSITALFPLSILLVLTVSSSRKAKMVSPLLGHFMHMFALLFHCNQAFVNLCVCRSCGPINETAMTSNSSPSSFLGSAVIHRRKQCQWMTFLIKQRIHFSNLKNICMWEPWNGLVPIVSRFYCDSNTLYI